MVFCQLAHKTDEKDRFPWCNIPKKTALFQWKSAVIITKDWLKAVPVPPESAGGRPLPARPDPKAHFP